MTTFAGGMTAANFYSGLNYTPKVYNVKEYGAVGNGSDDDTAAIQSAINAAYTAGGGIVWIPRGVYAIGGALQTNVGGVNYNSQLYIPQVDSNDATRCGVIIRGECVPSFVQTGDVMVLPDYVAPLTGTVLKSTLISTTALSSVIASKGASGNVISGINYNTCCIENIQILTTVNANSAVCHGGINFNYSGDCMIRNVTVFPFNISLKNIIAPVNNCIGIAMPKILAEATNVCESCFVAGFESGYLTGDHTFLNNDIAYCCKYGFNFGANYNAVLATKILGIHCVNTIFVSGVAYFKIEDLETEWYLPGLWNDSVYTVLDASNQGHGEIHYHTTEYGVGYSPTRFVKSGGANIQCIPMAFAAASSFTVTGKRNDATALTNLLTALAAKGIIVDSTTAS
jgi:hypothetical protein